MPRPNRQKEKNLFKKIKRRFHYDVWYWNKENARVSKYFESVKKAKKYVNHIHNSDLIKEGDFVGIEKTWCYSEHSPRHKWYYESYYPGFYILVDKW